MLSELTSQRRYQVVNLILNPGIEAGLQSIGCVIQGLLLSER